MKKIRFCEVPSQRQKCLRHSQTSRTSEKGAKSSRRFLTERYRASLRGGGPAVAFGSHAETKARERANAAGIGARSFT